MVVKKTSKEFIVFEKEEKEILTIDSNTGDKLMVYDKNLVQNLINQKFENKYKRLLKLVLEVAEDDDATDTDSDLILSKIEELRIFVLNRYVKYVSENTINKYLRKIYILEEKLKFSKIKGIKR